MNLAHFHALLAPTGQEALHTAMQMAPREENFLHDFAALQKRFPADLARAALETAILRGEAAHKFTHPEGMYFTREALEQASPEEVSRYRSQRYTPFERVADLGCSVGCDTFALARHAPTLGIDLDPLRLAMAAANSQQEMGAQGPGYQAWFAQADLTGALPLVSSRPNSLALFFDPARRAGQRRAFSVRD